MTRFLHIADTKPVDAIFTDVFVKILREIGELTLVENGRNLSEEERTRLIRGCTILLTGWGSAPVPASLAEDRGSLEYICHVTGGMRGTIPLELIDAGIPVTNWGDAPAVGVAEGAMALLLGCLKDLHHSMRIIAEGEWGKDLTTHGGWLWNLSVGVYGYGAIGRYFVDLLRPFGCTTRIFDPYAPEVPADCIRVDSLEELFRESEAIVIHAGLTEGTYHTVTAELLAMLPRHGIIVNTARGGIIDQDALFRELESGRLRAGLDVTDPEPLPPDHPARRWDNLILTGHRIEHPWPLDGEQPKALTRMQAIALDNIRRHLAGEPLRFRMDHQRYVLST